MRYTLFALLIVILAAVLRFYRLPELFVFGFNEEYQANLAFSIVKDFHVIWIGVSAAHLGVYLGPLFTYFTALWLFLSRGDPLITAYIGASLGVIVTVLMYFVGKTMFNPGVGLLAALLYATLSWVVFYDQKYWNVTPLPILSLLMVFSLYKIESSGRWVYISVFLLAIFFHTDLAILPLIFPFLWYVYLYFNQFRRRLIGLMVIFAVISMPLIVFDYLHDWSNISAPFRYQEFVSQKGASIDPIYHFEVLSHYLSRVWYLKPHRSNSDEVLPNCDAKAYFNDPKVLSYVTSRTSPPQILGVLAVILLVIYLLMPSSWTARGSNLLAVSLVSCTICFLLFPGGPFEHYIVPLVPLYLMAVAIVIDKMKNISKLSLTLFISVMMIFSIFTILTASDEYGLTAKKKLIQEVMNVVGDQRYSIRESGLCHDFEGWGYLFKVYTRPPEKAAIDKTLGWIYPDELKKNPYSDFEVVMSETQVPLVEGSGYPIKIIHKGFTAFIRPLGPNEQ